jgi:hypothetical protein
VKGRGLIALALAGGTVYWVIKTQPTASGFVDSLVRPLMGSKAVVKESEHKRVMDEVVPAAPDSEQRVSTEMVREGMKAAEVEDLLGRPDRVEEIREKGKKTRVRWVYLVAGRNLVFEDGRVVSIAIR